MTDGTGSSESATDADALWKPSALAPPMPVTPTVVDAEPPSAVDSGEPAGSPWSSESDAVFAATSTAVFDLPAPVARTGQRVDAPVASPATHRSRWVAIALLTGLAVAAVFLARSVTSDDLAATVAPASGVQDVAGTDDALDAVGVSSAALPLITEPFAGADPRRLPEQLDQRWRTDIAGVSATGWTRLRVLDDGNVVGVFDDDSNDDGQAGAFVIGLDGVTGAERWRTPFAGSQARSLEVLGRFDGVVVFERLDTENRAVLGLSLETGEVLWVRDTNDPGVHTALEGTGLVVRVSFTVNARLTFIDPSSGEEVGRVPGRLFATDYLGTWYVRNANVISQLDLRNGWNPATPFATLWVDDNEPATVVGEQVVAINDGSLEILGDDGEPTSVATVRVGAGFTELEGGTRFSQLAPMAEGAFVIVGPRSVFGAALDENGDADVRWRASGTPISSRPTDRGLTLLLATDGGAVQRVIDGSTGREIAVVQMAAGSADALQLVGNGIVMKQSALVGFERVGLDLDGNRLWSLVGDGPLAIGPGVVVTFGPSDAGVAVTAYGDLVP